MTPLLLKAGQNIVVYTGTATLPLSGQSWYNTTNVLKIFAISPNNQAYPSGTPGNNFGVTQLTPAVAGRRSGYIIVAKVDFSVDAALFGPLPKPTISSLFPATVAQLGTLNITGTNLDLVDYVIIGGLQAAINTSSTTTTNVTVTVPMTTTAGSNVPVLVFSMAAGGALLSTLTVTTAGSTTKLAKPVIATPVSVTSTTATFSLTAPVPNANSYFFRLNSGTVYPLGNVTTYTATGLNPGAAVTGEFYATDTTGTYTTSDYSTLVSATTASNAAPTITSLNPSTGGVGTSVTLTGTNLTGATAVSFSGTAASGFVVNTAGTSLTVNVPTGATSGAITVTTPGGTASSSSFTVTTSSLPVSYVVTMSGQSNMQGLAPRSELFTGTFANVTPSFTRQYQKAKVWNPTTNQVEKLQVGSANSAQALASFLGNEQGQQYPERPAGYEDGFGYMIPLAQQFELQNPTGNAEICFVEVAIGATPIAKFQADFGGAGSLFDQLHTNYNALVSDRTAAGRQVIHLGHLFFQGEADGDSTTYAADMAKLAASYRSQIFTPATKIVVSLCKSNATVAAQQRIWQAQDSNGVIIETNEATRIFDLLHIDAKSIIKMGMEPVYNTLFGTNVTAPIPATLPGGYNWMSYHKSYLPGATSSRWKNYAGRTSDFDLVQPDPASQFTLATGRTGVACYRSNGTSSVFTSLKPESGNAFTFIVAVDLTGSSRAHGVFESNVFLCAGNVPRDISDGKGVYSVGNLATATDKIVILSVVFGVGADNSYLRYNGNVVWRGTLSVDTLGQLQIGTGAGNYMLGDYYAFLAAQRAIPPTELSTIENQLASELSVTFIPASVPSGPGQYYDGEGLLNASEWINNVAPSANFKGNSNLVTNTDIRLYGSFTLDATRTIVFYGIKNSNYGQSTWAIDGQTPIAVNQNDTSYSNGSVELLRFSLPAGHYTYVYYRVAGQNSSTYVGFDGFDIV